ncbi:PhzF family phenazine biosynthesis protein [Ruminococcaceae bacterium OttesenSCG-928-L11]|nr:PhzF family phenazine biosynthesis protein [Ruminococcaceae bacterium OttesenSCG-928-L11]
MSVKYYHVDVFSKVPMSGNGLTVVFHDGQQSDKDLISITKELNQFESIFLYPMENGMFQARIFTVQEELTFAGHPILGAGAVIHKLFYADDRAIDIPLSLGERSILIHSESAGQHFEVKMNQGAATFVSTIGSAEHLRIAESLNLSLDDIDKNYPIETVSMGLPYLLVPVNKNIEKCRISRSDFELFLSGFGAKFVYVYDTSTLHCRTWDNDGAVEDVATGSAAGPLCAYLVKNGRATQGDTITLHQGSYVGRSSVIKGCVDSRNEVIIMGDVAFFAMGTIFV